MLNSRQLRRSKCASFRPLIVSDKKFKLEYDSIVRTLDYKLVLFVISRLKEKLL